MMDDRAYHKAQLRRLGYTGGFDEVSLREELIRLEDEVVTLTETTVILEVNIILAKAEDS